MAQAKNELVYPEQTSLQPTDLIFMSESKESTDAGKFGANLPVSVLNQYITDNINLNELQGTLGVSKGGTGYESDYLPGELLTGNNTGGLTKRLLVAGDNVDIDVNLTSGEITINAPGGTGDITNAANVGIGGIGVFDNKTSSILNFRNISAATSRIIVALDSPNKEITLDVDEDSIDIANTTGLLPAARIANILPVLHGGTGLSTFGSGQVPIGTSGGTLVSASLIAGAGITITPASGAITIGNTNPLIVAGSANGQLPIWNNTSTAWNVNTLTAGSSKLGITNGAGSVSLDVVESNINVANTGGNLPFSRVTGTVPIIQGGTGLSAPTYNNGQLLIGNGSTLTAATLTAASSKLGITNGSGSISLDVVEANINVGNTTGNLPAARISGVLSTSQYSFPFAYTLGFIYAYASTTTATIGIGTTRDSTDIFNLILTVAKTLSISSTGINALDTGSVAANTWYALFVIGDSTLVNGTQTLISLSATSPTLPSGYNKFRRIGWLKTNASSQLLRFVMEGINNERLVVWLEINTVTSVLTNGNAIAFTNIDASAYVPSTAVNTTLGVIFDSSGPGTNEGDALSLKSPSSTVTVVGAQNRHSSGRKGISQTLMIVGTAAGVFQYANSVVGDLTSLSVFKWTDVI